MMDIARQYLIGIADAVIATADTKGNIKLNQMVKLWSAGAAGGAFRGFLTGLIAFNSRLGVAVGAGAGAFSGALTDYGINDKVMTGAASVLLPGQTALLMMMRTTAPDRVIERPGENAGKILRPNLDREAENHLRRVVDEAPAKALAGEEQAAAM